MLYTPPIIAEISILFLNIFRFCFLAPPSKAISFSTTQHLTEKLDFHQRHQLQLLPYLHLKTNKAPSKRCFSWYLRSTTQLPSSRQPTYHGRSHTQGKLCGRVLLHRSQSKPLLQELLPCSEFFFCHVWLTRLCVLDVP